MNMLGASTTEDALVAITSRMPNDVRLIVQAAKRLERPAHLAKSFDAGLDIARRQQDFTQSVPLGKDETARTLQTSRFFVLEPNIGEVDRLARLFNQPKWRIVTAAITRACLDLHNNLFRQVALRIQREADLRFDGKEFDHFTHRAPERDFSREADNLKKLGWMPDGKAVRIGRGLMEQSFRRFIEGSENT